MEHGKIFQDINLKVNSSKTYKMERRLIELILSHTLFQQ